MKQDIQALSRAESYSDRNLDADKNTMELANDDELKEISKRLDTQISSQEDLLNQRRGRIEKNSDHIMQSAIATGQIGKASMSTEAASHQLDAGQFESKKIMSQEGGKIMDELYQMSSQNSSKYAEMSVQLCTLHSDFF